MNRLQTIISAVTSAANMDMPMSDMSLDTKVFLAYNCVKSALNSQKYWEQQATDAENPDSEKYCHARAQEAALCLPSLYHFLNSASHYVEAGDSHILFDDAHIELESDGEGGSDAVLRGDETHSETVATASHIHAWAKRSLADAGNWQDLPFTGDTIRWYNLPQIADRTTGQFIGKYILAFGEDSNRDTRQDARDMEIIAISPAAKAIAAAKNHYLRVTRMLELARKYTPYDRVAEGPVKVKRLMEAYEALVDADENDDAKAELKKDIKDVREDVRQARRVAILMAEMQKGIAQMTADGIAPEVIAAFSKATADRITA